MTQARFPRKLEFLFAPKRYKVIHGGRGSGKSWGIARSLLIQAAQRPLRILCTREVQKSIKDSVHKLLKDQIEALGLGRHFEVLNNEIRCVNGSEFLFAGLSDQTAESIKSYEGVDIVWVEEAANVTANSWKILIPTIRKKGSEIWASYNPGLDSDPTHVMFTVNPPPNATVVQMNFGDNPWFKDTELVEEEAHDRATLPKAEYENKWLGKCLPAVAGAIYADEVMAAHESQRIDCVPYDPRLKVFPVFDLGWNDAMCVLLAQRHHSQVRIIKALTWRGKTLEYVSAELKELKMNWGDMFLPHDGENGDYKTGLTAKQIMESFGWTVQIIPTYPGALEDGIRKARSMFPRTVFDREGCEALLESLRRYKRSIPQSTGEPGRPVHDEHSHFADAFRYVAVSEAQMINETWGGSLNYPQLRTV